MQLTVDPGVFMARLREYEWWLFRGIAFSRVALVAGLGVILPDERSLHGEWLFHVLVVAWILTFVWVAAPILRPRRVFDRVAARPSFVRLRASRYGIWAGGTLLQEIRSRKFRCRVVRPLVPVGLEGDLAPPLFEDVGAADRPISPGDVVQRPGWPANCETACVIR